MTEPGPKVLVTGATGFIGSALCHALRQTNISVRALVRPQSLTIAETRLAGVDLHTGDLLDPASLVPACENISVVVHTAGLAHVANVNEAQSFQANVDTTRNLVQAASITGIDRLIYLSSALATEAEQDEAQSQETGVYGRAKLAAENTIGQTLAQGSPDYVILRPANVYGPGMRGNVRSLINLIQRGWAPGLPDFAGRLSMVSLEDLISVIQQSFSLKSMSRKTYTVTDGIAYSLVDIETAIYAALGRRYPAWRVPPVVLYAAVGVAGLGNRLRGSKGGLSMETWRRLTSGKACSNRKLVNDIGFKPSKNFQQALPAILASLENVEEG